MDRAGLEEMLTDKERPQRERLSTLRADWTSWLEAQDDTELLECLRLIRRGFNSKKLKGARDELIGELRRDGLGGSAPLPSPPALPEPPVEPVAESATPEPGIHNPELEALIGRDPRSKESRLVYRDWLEGRGLVRDGRVTLGPLAECDDMLEDVEWQAGFIRRCLLRYTSARFNGERAQVSVEQALGWLLDEPGPGRFLEELVVGLVLHDDNNYSRVIDVLARRPRPTLEKLFLGDFGYEECELNWSHLGDASALWPMVPRLRELTLRAHDMTLGEIALPELRRFETICGGLPQAAALSIAHARWPKLEVLSLQYGPEGTHDPAVVDPILEGASLPVLRHLGLTNCGFTDAICEKLVVSPVLARLDVLDLSMGTMGGDGARALSRRPDLLAHLSRLDVSDNYLDAEAIALLQAACPNLVAGDQRDDGGDPGHRYASALE